ncbi:hypothetical protein BJF81_14285 [Ornithinimicrobium sp. CNJ-824]|nr:hypothetical protein BJF81_14285 [Ornithinimicrobium sp. CNJ-824]
MVASVVAAVSTLPPLAAGLMLVWSDLQTSGEKFDGLGLALGGALLVPVAVVLLVLVLFWVRGGRVAFWTATAAAAVLALGLLWSGFSFPS